MSTAETVDRIGSLMVAADLVLRETESVLGEHRPSIDEDAVEVLAIRTDDPKARCAALSSLLQPSQDPSESATPEGSDVVQKPK